MEVVREAEGGGGAGLGLGGKRKIEEVEGSASVGESPAKKGPQPVPPIDVPFVQEEFCYKASKFLTRCRDCKDKQKHTISVSEAEEVCRFQHFRKIIKKKREVDDKVGYYFMPHGFCSPISDPKPEDVALWMPDGTHPPEELERDVCLQIIEQLGDQLCALISQELQAPKAERKVDELGWKRLVPGVREMCDVCITTVFNFHWICQSCGFLACLDCYRTRAEGKKDEGKEGQGKRKGKESKDEYGWMHCLPRIPAGVKGDEGDRPKIFHNPAEMQLIQIIPGDSLRDFSRLMHDVRHQWGIPQKCGGGNCPETIKARAVGPEGKAREIANKQQQVSPEPECVLPTNGHRNATVVEEAKTEQACPSDSDDDDDDDDIGFLNCGDVNKAQSKTKSNGGLAAAETADETVMDHDGSGSSIPSQSKEINSESESHPLLIFRDEETQNRFPGLPHSWLCLSTLLKLDDPAHPLNIKAFQLVWKGGQPVLVSGVGQRLNKDLWTPEAFREEYGSQKHDFINCISDVPLKDKLISTFWDGFLDVNERKKSGEGEEVLLKLKDWPPTEDFAKFSPARFEDLMQALPLKEYTQRRGKLNLAARLPASFSPPDLGPKMYIAYGHGHNLDKGTTVLHLDMSDAVNVMVHAGIPKNCDPDFQRAVEKAVMESDCDEFMKERVKAGEVPGAIWHIYRPSDAVKIRDMLKSYMVEEGMEIKPNHDPIHDQSFYLDKAKRLKLLEEYNVRGFPILQCDGDAVFIPAGAPHQVRNLYNCIKIAEDYVSPENVSHCFKLTEEFRTLSELHTNHEDKLQIKNIVFHAVKDAMSVLLSIADLPSQNTY